MTTKIRPKTPRHVLATDLDGTLIPLTGHPDNQTDLIRLGELLKQHGIPLVYVTGRNLESVKQAQSENPLPPPEWIICDVGTSIYQLKKDKPPQQVAEYQEHLQDLIVKLPIEELQDCLCDFKQLRLQEEEKQGPFKLSYYVNAQQLPAIAMELNRRLKELDAPYSLIASVDPFNGDGLMDFLPQAVSKAHALRWWCEFAGYEKESIVFAGDSGNDVAALTAGFRSIVVGNADCTVARQVSTIHSQNEWSNRVHLAQESATSGLLAGCRWFELFTETPISKSALYSQGAMPLSVNQTSFRVWAPKCSTVSVEIQRGAATHSHELSRDEPGFFFGSISDASPGDCYWYVLDHKLKRPDPTSRFQPDGVHGASQIIDPNRFAWSDQHWQGIAKKDLVIYELHIGTFTQAGTYHDAIEQLPTLKEFGITAIELLPVVQTPGARNWGYDGVNLYAPRNSYGSPDDLKAFVDACHEAGFAVILDVVYNHVGPEGNYHADFAPYYSTNHHTPWGDAFAFEEENSTHVREFILENAIYWLREFHLDGLRLDAVHCMSDDSTPHILEELREAVTKFKSQCNRQIHLIAEANIHDPKLLPADQSQPAYDAAWCDDIMHAIYSVVVPETNVTHREYLGPNDLAEALRYGFLYQGMPQQRMNENLRTQPANHTPNSVRESFVIALQNHDNVGNHPQGLRFHQLSSTAHQKTAAALILLYPAIPLIFMGEEHAEQSGFRFFVDFEDQAINQAVDQGRAAEYPDQEWTDAISPSEENAFRGSILSGSDDPTMFTWYKALVQTRKQWIVEDILTAENLTTIWEPDRNLFGLCFRVPNETDRFVITRLTPIHTAQPPIELSIEGELLLDSHGETTKPTNPIILTGPRALIGRGTYRINTNRPGPADT